MKAVLHAVRLKKKQEVKFENERNWIIKLRKASRKGSEY